MPKRIYFVLLALCFFIFSCSNDTDGTVYSSEIKNYSTKDGGSRYSVYAYSQNNQVSYDSSRTILPDSILFTDLDFYLFGKNTISGSEVTFITDGSSTTNCLKVSLAPSQDSDNCGTFNLNLSNSSYNLYLAAVLKGKAFDKSNIQNNTILIANTTVDLRMSDSIRFYLSSQSFDGNASMPANIKLGLYTKNWSYTDFNDSASNFTCTVGLYECNIENTPVSNTEITSYTLPACYINPSSTQRSIPSNCSDLDIIYNMENVTPGVYNFTLHIYDQNDASRSYYYSDLVMLLANQDIETLIEIPNIMEGKPEAPSDFIVGYIEPSDFDEDKYYVELEWIDNSLKEEYFKLELMEISDEIISGVNVSDALKAILGKSNVAANVIDNSWEALAANYQTFDISNSYFEDIGAVSAGEVFGSLSKNSSYLRFAISLGSRYLMRLCAVNSAGSSSYVYPNIYEGNFKYSGSSVCNSWTWDDSDDNNCNLSINLYRLSYNMDMGSFYDDSDNSNVSSYMTIDDVKGVVYKSQTTNGESIFEPKSISYTKDSSSSTATLKGKVISDDGTTYYPWQEWKQTSLLGDSFIESSYNGYKNLYLFAYFGVDNVEVDTVLSAYDGSIKYEESDFFVAVEEGVEASYSGSHILPAAKDNNETKITISLSNYQTLYTLIIDDDTYEKFYRTKVEMGKQGGLYSNLTYVDNITSNYTYSGSQVRLTHKLYMADISTLSSGTYYLNVKVKPYCYSSESLYSVSLILED